MQKLIPDTLGSERSVEIQFIAKMISKYGKNKSILDVGGIPSNNEVYKPILESVALNNSTYTISDFRGGKYQGDFVTLDIKEKFDIVMFVSSLEHFPQCTEGDMVFRPDEDRKGFAKALSILKDNGLVFLTVPFGKQVWQPYHQNYNEEGIKDLTKGSTIIEGYTYKLVEEESTYWQNVPMSSLINSIYDHRAHGVGCFVLAKDE